MATTYPIDLVGGSEGGVGKSFVSLALADHLQRRDFPVALVETDTSNPDVMKAIQDEGHNITPNLLGHDQKPFVLLALNPRRFTTATAPRRACFRIAVFRWHGGFCSLPARYALTAENIFGGDPVLLNNIADLLDDGLLLRNSCRFRFLLQRFELCFQFGVSRHLIGSR